MELRRSHLAQSSYREPPVFALHRFSRTFAGDRDDSTRFDYYHRFPSNPSESPQSDTTIDKMNLPTPDQVSKVRAGTHCWGAHCRTCDEVIFLEHDRTYGTCTCGGCTVQQSGSSAKIGGTSKRKTLLIDLSTGLADGGQPRDAGGCVQPSSSNRQEAFHVKMAWIALSAFVCLGAPLIITFHAIHALADKEYSVAVFLILISWPVFLWGGGAFIAYLRQGLRNGGK
jgi:hypothetical protein